MNGRYDRQPESDSIRVDLPVLAAAVGGARALAALRKARLEQERARLAELEARGKPGPTHTAPEARAPREPSARPPGSETP